ncbi:FKBP-type peptidyl-prolyl cis-trans isomerase [Nonomuraea sp. NPDC048916]|uniref:FKBP-type peptidyl-prolyl cis-trans isomerase n=1 Tax=Nonomuraea sp. NPDC048916 TaxID=3154232 RepID=UPI00340C7680
MRLFWPAVLMVATSCGMPEAGDVPIVTGAFGSKPVIVIPNAKPGHTPRVTVLSTGDGRRTVPGDVVLADVSVHQWSGDRPYLSTYDANRPTTVVFDGRPIPDTWHRALIGRPAGSRVMLVSPAAQAAGPGVPLTGIAPPEVVVLVFDILGGYPPDARLVGRALPAVPADLTPGAPARILIDGSGAEVRPGSKVVVQYVAAEWPSRKVVDSSYRRGGPSAFELAPGAVPAAWLDALPGRRVGARLALGAPDEARLYVVDIVDALASR